MVCLRLNAQNTTGDLVKEGIALHNQAKYTEAIAKFNEALKNDPDNAYANYEMAFSLYAAKRSNEAIPYLDKATKAPSALLSVPAYCLLATIYDEDKLSQKAIDTYNAAIKINPDYPQVYYNLGVAYSRSQQYVEAEASAIEAIRHNPKHAGSQRLYALAAFHQNKRANALMGFCSFLLLEPTGARATEAYGNIRHIIQGGVLRDDKGNVVASGKEDKETIALNQGISAAVIAGKNKKLVGADLLAYQLKSIFTLAGQLSEKKTDKNFYDLFFAGYFYKLAQSNNMPAFVHAITLSDATMNSANWNKQNAAQTGALNDWLKSTERVF